MANTGERDWDTWGAQNPFFGVLSDPKYLNANLNDDSVQEFFDSGERHVEHVYFVIHSKIRQRFRADRVLDFGCGVGRLLIPLARRSHIAVGVDISPRMLSEARKNCDKLNLQGIRLLDLHDMDSLEPNSFDLVHSFIVFQHIPVSHGERTLRKLLGLMANDGIGVIHLTFSDVRSRLHRIVLATRSRSRLMHGLFNKVQRRAFSWPLMQMNSYSLNRIFNILVEGNCVNLHIEFTDHGGFRGAMLYFEKLARPI